MGVVEAEAVMEGEATVEEAVAEEEVMEVATVVVNFSNYFGCYPGTYDLIV